MPTKVALIADITCQDGAFLAESLLRKGYEVHGISQRASLHSAECTDSLYQNPDMDGSHFVVHQGDVSEAASLIRLVQKLQPDEIYNLTTQSSSPVRNEEAEQMAVGHANSLAVLNLLEAIRVSGLEKKTRFYQGGTSELYGFVQEETLKSSDALSVSSVQAAARLAAHQVTVKYRQTYGMYACNGILFNGESPVRGESAVSRKITRAVARVSLGLQDCVRVGNLNELRDWGHARDYVEMQWLTLQQAAPDDFVIATGRQYSVRHFVRSAFATLGIDVEFEGSMGLEIGRVVGVSDDEVRCTVGHVVVRVDPNCARGAFDGAPQTERGKGKQKLIWSPSTTFSEFVSEMIAPECLAAKRALRIKNASAHPSNYHD
jgi:GDPmannose 4,6-dehydratase